MEPSPVPLPKIGPLILALLVTVSLTATVAAGEGTATETQPSAQRTVLWLSVDGFRPDYIHPDRTPYLNRWRDSEVSSDRMQTVVPSLTFPSHVSQATGVTVEKHGIPANAFWDPEMAKVLYSPGDPRLLEAEPIWLTAARQGIAVLVHDWPLSHAQRHEPKARYFGDRYRKEMSDEDRLELLLETWDADSMHPHLQLVMGYIEGTDVLGHRYGPDSPKVLERATWVDQALEETVGRAREIWARTAGPTDEMYVMVTSDHGMERVHTGVHPEKLFGLSERSVRLVTSGNVANYFMPGADEEEINAEVLRLSAYPFLHVYRWGETPVEWGYRHPKRVGDIVVFLRPGYTFYRSGDELLIRAQGDDFDLLGMHGYLPEDSSAMSGLLLVRRFPEPLPHRNLGLISSLSLHSTVARLLGIAAAPDALTSPLELER